MYCPLWSYSCLCIVYQFFELLVSNEHTYYKRAVWSHHTAIESPLNRSSLVEIKWPKINCSGMSTENSEQINPPSLPKLNKFETGFFTFWTYNGSRKTSRGIFHSFFPICSISQLRITAQTKIQTCNIISVKWNYIDPEIFCLLKSQIRSPTHMTAHINQKPEEATVYNMQGYSMYWLGHHQWFYFVKYCYARRPHHHKCRAKKRYFNFQVHQYQASGARFALS